MRTSPTIAAIAPALVAAAPGLPDPAKARKADAGMARYTYASLSDFAASLRAHLAAHGLTVHQDVDTSRLTPALPWQERSKGQVQWSGETPAAVVVTRILHTSGEWVEGDYPVSLAHDPQDQGSAMTYSRRYGLLALLGMAPEDDDDAARMRKRERTVKEAPASAAQRKAAHHPTWEAARSAFCAALQGVTYDEVAGWCEAHQRPRPSAMTPEQRGKLAAWLATEEGRVKVKEWAGKQAGGGA